MQLNYLDAVSSVLNLMKQPDSTCKNIDIHKTCYSTLFRHLLEEGIPFSMEAALEWLEIKKQEISYATCSQYRNALFRLEHYILFGNIDTPPCHSEESFFCRSGMSESFYYLTYELEEYFGVAQNPCYYNTYSVAIKNFFRLATATGATEPEAITLDTLIEYWNRYCKPMDSVSRRQNSVWAMTALMKYLNLRGDVPCCYQLALFNGNAEKLTAMKLSQTGTSFHPSMELESKANEYLNVLDTWKYQESSKDIYRNDITWYFLFLELNHLPHSSDTVEAWIAVLSEYPEQKRPSCSVSVRRAHTVRMFSSYLQGTMTGNMPYEHPKEAEDLPEWSRGILTEFVKSRKRDGMAKSTLNMCRAAGCNFFQYLDQAGITGPDAITPEVVMAFHNQDVHSTPESKNAYSIKLRQLLRYMADIDLVSPTLPFAVSTSCAPCRNIVDVLSDEMVEKIYEYRKTASTPLELRDTAIVMLGLRMGIRGADILKLQINDFDWKAKTVSFVQQKTRTSITLPVPTDVGNSVCQYILKGRPQSAEAGKGYIFIHHQAPYVPLKVTTACRAALKRILSVYGFELSPGQGFHMTRKTFATRMLRAGNRLDVISNALGHARKETAEVYLERDETGMRLCPINFGGILS